MTKFDKMPEERRKKLSAKGGRKKNPNKGFGSLTKEQRSEVSKRAAQARWKNKRKEVSHGQAVDTTENQPKQAV